MKAKLIIFGAGGHAKVVIETAKKCGYEPIAVYDDNDKLIGTEVAGVPVMGSIVALSDEIMGCAFIAIGNNQVRKMLAQRFKKLQWSSLLHPAAYVCSTVKIGHGTLVCAGAVIQPDVVVGDHVIINTNASIDHDCVIGDYSHISPGCTLAGGSRVGEGTILGIGTCLIPLIQVGAWCTIGAGSVVVRNILAHMKGVGMPARVRRN